MELTKLKRDFRVGSRRQRGVATLMVSVSIALLMAVAAVGMMRSGMLEQRIAANDLRAREAQEIAQAGWDYAMVSDVNIEKKCNDEPIGVSEFSLSSFSVPPAIEPYSVKFFGCYTETNGKKFFRIKSEARSGNTDVGSASVVDAIFMNKSTLKNNNFMLPAFLVKGTFCENNKKGKNGKNGNNGNSCVTGTTLPSGVSPKTVIATGNIGSEYVGDPGYEPNFNEINTSDSYGAWNYVFDIAINDAKEMASSSDGACKPFCFYGDVNLSVGEIGSENSPVVLIVDALNSQNCTNIAGQVEIYGVVYLGSNCVQKGWGNAKIHGSIVSDGSIEKLPGSLDYEKFNGNTWSSFLQNNKSDKFLIPGTWKDF